MSRQLSLSATLSALAMALFALVMRANGGDELPSGGLDTGFTAQVSLG